METGRELFTKFMKREPLSRPAFVPLVRGLAARVGGVSAETWNSDPTLWANSLGQTAELFALDGIVAGLDFTIMAEACGCTVAWRYDRPVITSPVKILCEAPEESGRMKKALEAARRIFEVCRKERACIAATTGPVTLASQLFGREDGPKRLGEVKEAVVRVTEALCKIRPDFLIFMEGRPLAQADLGMPHRKIYNTLKNILSYYNVHGGLYLQGYHVENVHVFSTLKMELYILGPSLGASLPTISGIWDLSSGAMGFGLGLPLNDLPKARELISECLDFYRLKEKRNFFFTSLGPVTRDTNLEVLRQLAMDIRQIHFDS